MRITALLDTSRPVHLGFPHRLRPGTSPHALRIPPHGGHPALRSTASGSPASEAMNPAFGYGAPHLSARGTLTLLNDALLSAPSRPGHSFPRSAHHKFRPTGWARFFSRSGRRRAGRSPFA